MNFIALFFFLLVFCGCESEYTYHPSEKQRMVNIIRKKTAFRIKQELGLIPFGTGGQMMDQIKMLHLGFLYHQPLDVEKGRKLLLAAVDTFASEVNANESVRPFLDNYPFGPQNIEIVIYIQKEDGSQFSRDDLCVISAKNGILKYLSDDPNGPLFKTVYSETYEEALKNAKVLEHPEADK